MMLLPSVVLPTRRCDFTCHIGGCRTPYTSSAHSARAPRPYCSSAPTSAYEAALQNKAGIRKVTIRQMVVPTRRNPAGENPAGENPASRNPAGRMKRGTFTIFRDKRVVCLDIRVVACHLVELAGRA